MNRVAFFIDGFNLYHSLRDNAPECRWLNLRKLCEHYVDNRKETIVKIYYFSAIAYWHPDVSKVQKHTKYINRLRQENIIPVLGKFKEKDTCIARSAEHITNPTKRSVPMSMLLSR